MSLNLRIWGILCGAGAVAVLGGGFFLGAQPALASASAVDEQAATIAARNQVSTMTLAALSRQNAKVSDMQAQQKVLLKAVPEVLKPNTFIRRVTEVAAIDNVTIQGITLSEAAAYTAPASAGTDATASGAGSGTAAAPSAGASAVPGLVKTDPSITGQNFAVVPVSVQVSGAQSALMQFVHDIQTDQRVFVISNIASATDDSGKIGTTLSGYIYALQR